LSADGNTLASGGSGDNSGVGAVWVFVRVGGVWGQQGNKLVGTGGVGNAYQGAAIPRAGDESTLPRGGGWDNSPLAAVLLVYRDLGGVWTQQGNKLVGTGGVGSYQHQGFAVSLGADGNTLLSGANGDQNTVGAVWVFVRVDGVWTQQGSKMVGTGYSNGTSG